MSDLIERVAKVLNPEAFAAEWDDSKEWARDEARDAISVVLKEMLAGRSINLAGEEFTERFRDTIRCFAKRENINVD